MWRWCRFQLPCVSQRYVMCTLAVVGSAILWMMYCSRYRMFREVITHPYEHSLVIKSFVPGRCFNAPPKQDVRNKRYVKVYWPRAVQRSVKHAFWVGSAVSSIASGLVVESLGPRLLWGVGGSVAAIASSSLPLMAKVSPYATLCALAVAGLGFGVVFPCCSVIAVHWAPQDGRTFFVAVIESALLLGVMAAFVLHIAVDIEGGWETWLYLSCVMNIIWVVVWFTMFYNRPSDLPRAPSTPPPNERRLNVPWTQILLSPPFLSLQLLNLASEWARSIIFYQMEVYLKHVFSPDDVMLPDTYMPAVIATVGIVSVLLHAWIRDKLILRGYASRTASARFLILFGNYASAGLLMAIPLFECRVHMVLMCFYGLIFAQGMAYGPLCANVVDLSPVHAGLLRGILSAGGALTSVFNRQLVNVIVKDESDRQYWAVVFNISASIMVIYSLPFTCFGSGDVQPWNFSPKRKSTRGESSHTASASPGPPEAGN